MKIIVGVSGGVDSSVSAALLQEQGHTVIGAFIRTWTPEFIECTWRDERRDAMRVCAHLGIPFLEIDLEKEYKEGVADYMIAEYKKGRTPNPDVMCNKQVKFGGFLKKAIELGADAIATGHYAQNIFNTKTKLYELHMGKDANKDQSYFLYMLGQEALSRTLFPVGHLEKSAVRKLAEKFKLPTATKKDSQGVCFIGKLDMKEFLKAYIPPKEGIVVDEKGQTIGHHEGVWFYTLGERHGFTITKKTSSDAPYYIVEKDIEKNILVVSHSLSQKGNKKKKEIILENVHSISDTIVQNKKYKARYRYRGTLIDCVISNEKVVFETEETTASSGQSVVIYDKTKCLGGGVIA